jgi:hypothetical protein
MEQQSRPSLKLGLEEERQKEKEQVLWSTKDVLHKQACLSRAKMKETSHACSIKG